VPKDEARALELYARGCELGDDVGCELGDDVGCAGVAYCLTSGIGLPEAQARARRLLEKRCRELRHEAACSALSKLSP
jgi:TPR repeat protein